LTKISLFITDNSSHSRGWRADDDPNLLGPLRYFKNYERAGPMLRIKVFCRYAETLLWVN
jgi:hypothetical protein